MAVVRHLREQYTPGQIAPVSGVYTIVHHRGHRDDHDVVVISGDEFPACRECKGNVRYTIRQQVAYITHDFDLTAPAELLSRRTVKLA
jgi:hypothetical protein